MKSASLIAAGALIFATAVSADQQWQKPAVKACELGPGGQCNVEVTCPDSHPRAVAGGGMPKAEPENNQVAMTMNLPLSESKWRVRWKNLPTTDPASVKVAVKVLCGTR